MTALRCIVIDPKARTITEESITVDKDVLHALYERIGVSCLDIARLGRGIDLWVDDEGLLKDHSQQSFYRIGGAQGRVLAGISVMLASDAEGDTVGLPGWLSLASVTRIVEWVDSDCPDIPEPFFHVTAFRG
jgi:hypothetical protein